MEAGDTSMAGEGPGYGSSASQPVCSREVMSLPPPARWPALDDTDNTAGHCGGISAEWKAVKNFTSGDAVSAGIRSRWISQRHALSPADLSPRAPVQQSSCAVISALANRCWS